MMQVWGCDDMFSYDGFHLGFMCFSLVFGSFRQLKVEKDQKTKRLEKPKFGHDFNHILNF